LNTFHFSVFSLYLDVLYFMAAKVQIFLRRQEGKKTRRKKSFFKEDKKSGSQGVKETGTKNGVATLMH